MESCSSATAPIRPSTKLRRVNSALISLATILTSSTASPGILYPDFTDSSLNLAHARSN
ncbi:hypothetical protein PF005_g4750 [Phytophthora fragariae]|uniref:Uncharacterized protein n=2 Tax=Phytophthora TaxID=4783 RepID=A0A6A3FJV2_9STRA|nr:hypothetical protein PF003_g14385 [Phytophthora fragariae]KAE9035459.1 hypothetical protein PR002_g7571 [Phytophthora rubi]KAE8945492.1 hypothetical protein PF009_g4856 [Phytophthora fragariae]KAE9008457.1 hypothetical protein PF011_g10702 [Phytophthora fragariae]KAE9036486.1 hypothetical protein PR001_g8809 [Phytophthora rubi]